MPEAPRRFTVCAVAQVAARRTYLSSLAKPASRLFSAHGMPSAEGLRKDYPALICCTISGYGDSGPYADRKAYDLLIQA